jgi:hypothetical protein
MSAFAKKSRLEPPPTIEQAPGNVDKPEVAPEGPAREPRRKEPLKDLNFKVPENFYWEFCDLAHARRLKHIQLLREMFDAYKHLAAK